MRKLPILTEKAVSDAKHHRRNQGLQLRMSMGEDITCRKGCAHCCYHPVRISILEGVSLYLYLKDQGLWDFNLRRSLDEHAKATLDLAPEVWMLSGIPCPLLTQESTCMAYVERPYLCHTALSVGDPDRCRPAEFSPSTPMVPRRSQLENYYTLEQRLLKSIRVPSVRVPVSFAVILGEKLAEGKIDPEDIHKEVVVAYSEDS